MGQTTAMHGLIVLAAAAILIAVAGAGKRFMSGSYDSSATNPRCAYSVFRAEQCMGTVFCDSRMSVPGIMERLGVHSGTAPTTQDEVPCFSCLRLEDGSKLVRIEPMKGSQILCCGRRMDLNLATADDLTVIPGIGPKLADRIVTFRESSGGFKDIGELRKIRGLRAKKVASAAQFVEIRAPEKNQ